MSSIAPIKEQIPSNVLAHLLDTVTKKPFTVPTIGNYMPFLSKNKN